MGFVMWRGRVVWWYRGLFNGFCDVAEESCLVVKRDYLMGFVI
jgi:hypothetical protein